MQQRQLFEFNNGANPQAKEGADPISRPPDESCASPLPSATLPPLVRATRQLTYGGDPSCQWPPPEHDRDTLTVDRLRHDIDGPPHRFVIKRGDMVEVFCSADDLPIGEVSGIDPLNRQVQVSFRNDDRGGWFALDQIFPAPETITPSPANPATPPRSTHKSEEVQNPSLDARQTGELTTLSEFRAFLAERCEGDLNDEQLACYDALHADFARELRAIERKTTADFHSIVTSKQQVKYLDGVCRRSQLKTLTMALRVARFARIRQTGGPRDEDELEPSQGDIRFVDYPYPTLHRHHLQRAILACQTENGASRAAEQLAHRLRRENGEYVTFRDEEEIQTLKELVEQMASRGYNAEVFSWALEKYDRLHEANITDIHELRAALREYLSDPESVLQILRRNRRKSRLSQESTRQSARFE